MLGELLCIIYYIKLYTILYIIVYRTHATGEREGTRVVLARVIFMTTTVSDVST